jgi:predicted nucleotidyltransferase component of viral defense system
MNAMSFKAHIKNLAKKRSVKAQVLLQNYMFERFLERLSLSDYKDKFVIKGGMLISAIVGINTRTTMDLDATIRDLLYTAESISKTIKLICAVQVDDEVTLTVGTVTSIRPDDKYSGYKVKITAKYATIETPFSIDISTGDIITPRPVKYTFRGIFEEEKQIELWVYNIETILSEKVETVLRRSTLNTRARDFYDIYILCKTQTYDTTLFCEAFIATALYRGTTELVSDIPALLKQIENSPELKQQWEKYTREFDYASDISYEQVMDAIKVMCVKLHYIINTKRRG